MTVTSACLEELESLGVVDTWDGQLAISLARAIDDRAGVQGLAATADRYHSLMVKLRDQHRPKELGRLDLIRGGTASSKSAPRRSAPTRRAAPTDREHAPRRARKAE